MHCLNLKITYNCTNNCPFCFAHHLQNEVIEEKGLFNAVYSGYGNGCRELVISGGEPTLLPDTICRLLDYANQLGYEKYILQTNGIGLSENPALVSALDQLALQRDVCISFSIHGHTHEIHDKMSGRRGAFQSLISAISNISTTRCHIYTNTVISSYNIHYVPQIIKLLLPYKPKLIQFAMMHLDHPSDISTGLVETASVLHTLAELPSNITDLIKTEGLPYCLMYGLEKCVGESYWPDTLDLYNKDNDYMLSFNQLESGMRWKAPSCKDCIMNELCAGIWKEHSNEFLQSGVHPIV